MKKRKLFLVSAALLLWFAGTAKEGMYLPYLLQKINAPEMQAMGMRITADEIYAVNRSSIKDAVVHFGGGCTAEIVSSKGLLLTNHHCGYRSIQKHSSVEHDYLTDGFWAKSQEDELPNPGLTATILQYMQDVTEEVLQGVTATMSEKQRSEKIQSNIAAFLQKSDRDRFHKYEIKAFYYGNQYILMVSKVFRDVRLVGAPPSNIGKFGGDTDNWMWPRHTGDFSVFRIYAGQDNNPADYSKDNKPYKPPYSLKISLRGYNEGDFTFVFGYPGRTQEYIPSFGVALITKTINPFKIKLRRQKLDIMASFMDKDAKTRIQYAAKYAGVANGWKKWIGEDKGIERLQTVARKEREEAEFTEWAQTEAPHLKNLIPAFHNAYNELKPWEMGYQYFVEAAYYQDLVRYAFGFMPLVKLSQDKKTKPEVLAKKVTDLQNTIEGFYKDYNPEVEKQLLIATIKAYKSFDYDGVPKPAILHIIDTKYGGSVEKYVNKAFEKSVFVSKEKMTRFLENYKASDYKKLGKDPIYRLAFSYRVTFISDIVPKERKYRAKIDSLQRLYMQALINKNKERYLYPDANSTLRVAYGKVEGFSPRDGVDYTYFTTLKGIMQKENPAIYDYVVEPKLKELYRQKDYDIYADKDGTMHVCFLASNHTTGGNSGSPVFNADGQLIGINFDRNWQGTMSDLNYDPSLCRNISLDIRYCLFIIDKFAGARRLVEEMELIN